MNLYYSLIFLLYNFLISIILDKKSKIIYVFSGLLFVIFAGLRSFESSKDAVFYYEYYKNIPDITSFFDYDNLVFEKGYMFVNMILKSFNLNYHFLFFTIAFISVTLNFISIKKYTKNIYFCVYIYLTNYYIINELILIRTGVALSIIFYSIHYMKNETKKYIFLIIIATLFHRISIIALIPFFFMKFKILTSKKRIIFFLVLSFILGEIDIFKIIYSSTRYIFPTKLSYYYDIYRYTRGSYRRLLLLLPILFYFLKNYEKYKKQKYFREAFSFLCCSVFSFLLFIKNDSFLRISFIYSIVIVILGDIFLNNLRKKEKKFWKIFLMSISTLLLIWSLRGNYLINFTLS